MSTEWLMSTRDTEIAADIEHAIESERGGSSGRRPRINYATGLVIEHVQPAEANDGVQAHRSATAPARPSLAD